MVIGGGVIGISTALFLNEAGVSVMVCEKGRVACEQSSRNWGWVRAQGRDAGELPIAIDSLNSWERISAEIGPDVGFERHGTLYLARSEGELAQLGEWLDVAKQHQLDTRLINRAEVDALIKDQGSHWHGALYTPSDGRAEAFTAVPAVARHIQKKGVLIRENCAVRTIDQEAGKVAGVVTEAGKVKAPSVVFAGGAWSTMFLRNLGVRLPQLTVRATVARTEPSDNFFSGNAAGAGIAFRRRQDGGYTIAPGGINEHYLSLDSFRYFFEYQNVLRESARNLKLRFGADVITRLLPKPKWHGDSITPFEETRNLSPDPAPDGVNRMRAGLRKYVPSLADVPFAESWAGMIDVTPDVVPVMDEIDSVPGLYLATGFSGHGFGFGPGAGKVMANMVLGNKAEYDLSRFRFSRFSDGSSMQPGPGL